MICFTKTRTKFKRRVSVVDKWMKTVHRLCPYLDTINRQVLDFDFEKLCSVSLSRINVYACLVCGKYFQGAYRHDFVFATNKAMCTNCIVFVFFVDQFQSTTIFRGCLLSSCLRSIVAMQAAAPTPTPTLTASPRATTFF